jgi:SMC interacting uncharacterized protein involved in chromosome segregation
LRLRSSRSNGEIAHSPSLYISSFPRFTRWAFVRYRTKADQLEKEKKLTAEALRPLQTQLRELDEQLKESAAKTSSLKAQIAKNDARAEQILQMVVQL